jgi:uncharacterized membrane protein (DUF2068 family)
MPRWSYESLECGLRGHVTPAATVARLRPDQEAFGVDLDDGLRLSRCIRCDTFVPSRPPEHPTSEELPAIEQIEIPHRGKALRDTFLLRLIAIDRGIHCLLFALLAVGLVVIELNLTGLKDQANSLIRNMQSTLGDTGRDPSRSFLLRQLHRIAELDPKAVKVLLATAIAYAVVEGVEAYGLWRAKRWAEYLTALATAGFLPFEINELRKRVTVVRLGALIVNIAILVYLVYAKRLFGVRGGAKADEEEMARAEVLKTPGREVTPSEPPRDGGAPGSDGAVAAGPAPG